MPDSWLLNGREEFVREKMQQIIGFRIDIERIEGKWKLSQNQPVVRLRAVIQALKARADENSRSIAALMEKTLGRV
jgi:transcriptional regulator